MAISVQLVYADRVGEDIHALARNASLLKKLLVPIAHRVRLEIDMPAVGQIGIACALAYQDLRFGGTWRKDHPKLVKYLEDFAAAVPAFAATKPA